jgi:hypothetical protein
MFPARGMAMPAVLVGLALMVCGVVLLAADRPARVLTPRGSPVWLDPHRSLLFDSPAVAVTRRNVFTAPVDHALRVWVFDERSALKGTQDYCSYETLGRDTRSLVLVPLEIPGVTVRDSAVVAVSAAASGRVAWALGESESVQLEAARAATRGSGGRLSLQRRDASPAGWECPCNCGLQKTACNERCSSSRAVAACTRMIDGGCSATCVCQ